MGKFCVRITVIFVAVYFITAYCMAQFMGIDIMDNFYKLFFEACTVIYAFSEGKYHCKFLKITALAILLCDIMSELDYHFNFLSVKQHNLIPVAILSVGFTYSLLKALIHFIKVIKIKHNRREKDS